MKWLKLFFKIIAGIVLLVVLLFVITVSYVHLNKKAVLNTITKQLNDNISGTLSIESMEPTIIRGFPGVSISLKNVLLRDSLWDQHHHDLLRAKELYVSVNALSIIRGGARVRDISINDADIYLFTDSNGYSNAKIFKPKEERDTTKKKNQPRINHIYFNKVNLVFENNTKNKLFQVDIKSMETVLDYKPDGWDAELDLYALVKQFNFNTAKGSFLKNKMLDGDLKLSYNKTKEILTIPEQSLDIDDDEISIGGHFMLAETPPTFVLNIKANQIKYKNATALLSPNISTKINTLDFEDPIDLQANISGSMKYRDTPLVKVSWQVEDNVFTTPGGDIKKCSFTGTFRNEIHPAKGRNDRNSRIGIHALKGEWSGIPFQADTITVDNLVSPVLEGRFTSKFALAKLNPIIGANIFTFDGGTLDMDLLYRAGIRNNTNTNPYIYGRINVGNAAMTYVPRNLSFTNSSATVQFAGSDVFLNNVRLQKDSAVLNMNGSLKNFLNLYYTNPEKIVLDWHIKSPEINVDDFKSFLTQRKKAVEVSSKNTTASEKATRISDQLDKVLDASSVHMDVKVDKLTYRQFLAEDIYANINLTQSDIILQKFDVKHADGRLRMSVHIKQQGPINDFKLNTQVEHVNVKKFFQALENFGQTSITDKNIEGVLSAKIDVTGAVKDDGKLMPRSIKGTAEFEVTDGALVSFEPFMKIGKFVFRKRNLDNVKFGPIKNKFDIDGERITIYPMFIESSVVNMNVEGVYSLGPKGTDINVDIPLRNPKKDELILDEDERHESNMQGLVLHLKAVDGEDGKVKIKWNRKNEDVGADSTQVESKPKKRRWFGGKKKK